MRKRKRPTQSELDNMSAKEKDAIIAYLFDTVEGARYISLITVYLLLMVLAYAYFLFYLSINELSSDFYRFKVGIICILIGGLAGTLYCLRSIYLNYCVFGRWDTRWHIWYFLRPIVSAFSGGISYLFLKAGLLILESGTQANASDLGFYALSFVAGFNVDKFIEKIEDIAQAVWGIEKSRASNKNAKKDTDG